MAGFGLGVRMVGGGGARGCYTPEERESPLSLHRSCLQAASTPCCLLSASPVVLHFPFPIGNL